jgi:hypothetical protein
MWSMVGCATALPKRVVQKVPAYNARVAQASLNLGTCQFIEANYPAAEHSAAMAIAAYPFLSQSQVLLAKVLLLRAMAEADPVLLHQAQQHVMAAARLEPRLLSTEATRLLDLLRLSLP